MAKIPFNIKYRPEIESGKYKVQTRDGRTVRIICWDRKGDDCPIIALLNNTYQEDFYDYFDDGRTTPTLDCGSDLLIITDESELTPFEEAVCNIYLSCGVAELSFQDKAKELLDIARKEIMKEMPRWREGLPPGKKALVVSSYDFICVNDKLLKLSSLEKLPGFKED